jgi:pimeloyl-ACP methyl ester carboxylesterase
VAPAAVLHSVWDVVDGMRVHSRVGGRALVRDGRDIVFVHGLGMSTGYLEPTMRLLANDFAVSALDQPGFGESRLRGRVLSLAQLAEALIGWIATRGIVAPILVGQSHGCQVVVEAVTRAPELARAVVLNAPTMLEGHRSVAALLLRVAMDTPREPLALVPHVVRDYLRAGPRRLLATAADAVHDQIEEKLPTVGVPVTVVCGERDPVSPPAWGERVAQLAGSRAGSGEARLVVVPGAAHALPFSHPAAFAAELVGVAARLEAVRAPR